MRRSSNPLPKDPNKLAYQIVKLSTEEPEPLKERSEISKYLSEIGKRGGLKGGPARAKKLSSKKRKEIAREAAKARWKRTKTHDRREN
ncbi:MAG: hypothetical protein ACLQGU_08290 [bacterium]